MSAHTQLRRAASGSLVSPRASCAALKAGERGSRPEPHCGPCTSMVNGHVTLRNTNDQFKLPFGYDFCTILSVQVLHRTAHRSAQAAVVSLDPRHAEIQNTSMPSQFTSPSSSSQPSPARSAEAPNGELAWIERIRQRAATTARNGDAAPILPTASTRRERGPAADMRAKRSRRGGSPRKPAAE